MGACLAGCGPCSAWTEQTGKSVPTGLPSLNAVSSTIKHVYGETCSIPTNHQRLVVAQSKHGMLNNGAVKKSQFVTYGQKKKKNYFKTPWCSTLSSNKLSVMIINIGLTVHVPEEVQWVYSPPRAKCTLHALRCALLHYCFTCSRGLESKVHGWECTNKSKGTNAIWGRFFLQGIKQKYSLEIPLCWILNAMSIL